METAPSLVVRSSIAWSKLTRLVRLTVRVPKPHDKTQSMVEAILRSHVNVDGSSSRYNESSAKPLPL
jgi:hypothetical protein